MSVEYITCYILALTAIIAWIGFKADHERRRKQATIESLTRIIEHYHSTTKIIYSKYKGATPVPVEEQDCEIKSHVETFLSALEYFSVGVNAGLYDLSIANKMSGKNFLKLSMKFEAFLKHEDDPERYQEFSLLCDRIRTLRQKQQACRMRHSKNE